ncbi:MAG TPA: hypothetical protein VK498_11540 [Ferruginibacter sp.]|nr:hypothetical protein [Ferruginibacter sp.]
MIRPRYGESSNLPRQRSRVFVKFFDLMLKLISGVGDPEPGHPPSETVMSRDVQGRE